MVPGAPRTVAVVGGGIAGLAAAWELCSGSDPAVKVVLLETQPRLGGKLLTEDLDGQAVDVGPDGFLGRRPEALALCHELGLDGQLVPVAAAGASVFARGRPRALPEGLLLGVPTRLWPLVASGILGPLGRLGVTRDALVPRPDLRGPLGDRAIGPLVARKLGHRVVDVLVDPLIGGIHAGTTADMSAAAVFPVLLEAAQRRGSFMRSLRSAGAISMPASSSAPPQGDEDQREGAHEERAAHESSGGGDRPAFFTLEGGLAALTDTLRRRLTARGAELRTASPVRSLRRQGTPGCWRLLTDDGSLLADGVVLAVPSSQAADLLEPHEEEAARLLRSFSYSSVTVVTLSVPLDAVPDDVAGTGVLVPAGTRSQALVEGPGGERGDATFMVTAFSFLSRKWPTLEGRGTAVVRASLGRAGDERVDLLDDAAVVRRVLEEAEVVLRRPLVPRSSLVTRWPQAFPQYRVHHLTRVAGVEAALRRLPALAAAGATYHGVGIPACIGSGRAAADAVRQALQKG